MKGKRVPGRGTRAPTPRPNAGRPANVSAFNTALDRLDYLIQRAARKPHSAEEARYILAKLNELAARYAAQQQINEQ